MTTPDSIRLKFKLIGNKATAPAKKRGGALGLFDDFDFLMGCRLTVKKSPTKQNLKSPTKVK